MEDNNKSYFGGIKFGLKSLLTGLGVTFREYLTKKVTEQYPENRKTTLHVSPRHRGRLIMPQDAEGNNKCIACKLCEMACPNGTIKSYRRQLRQRTVRKNVSLMIIFMIWANVCSVSCA